MKTVEHEDCSNTNCNWLAWKCSQRFRSWKSEDESRPSKRQNCLDRLEYWEESWRPDTCCHSDPIEKHQLTLGWKTLKLYNNNNYDNNNNNNNKGIPGWEGDPQGIAQETQLTNGIYTNHNHPSKLRHTKSFRNLRHANCLWYRDTNGGPNTGRNNRFNSS